MMVAAEGPNSSTAANTNASETEILAFIDGSLMLNEPVRNASQSKKQPLEDSGGASREVVDRCPDGERSCRNDRCDVEAGSWREPC